MLGRPGFIFHETEHGSSEWKWKGIKRNNRRKNVSISQFINDNRRKIEEALVGPGAGVGIGCGIGVGVGFVGGIGYGDPGWDNFRMVYGVGMGCGVGIGAGFGFRNGFGTGISLDSLRSRVFKPKPEYK